MSKRTLIILLMIMVACVGMFSAGATTKPNYAGDTDLDDIITVKDATLIQKFSAKLESFNYLQECVAEVDGDGQITVKDATMIQKKSAELIDFFNVPAFVWNDVHIKELNADYDSGKAMVGVPVKFTARGYGFAEPFLYQFYINDEAVTELTENNTYICTFDEVGYYTIKVRIVNRFNNGAYATLYNYEIVEPYESETLMIKSFICDHTNGSLYKGIGKTTFIADAMFGSGSYEYAFYWDGELIQGYSTNNIFKVEDFDKKGTFILTARVRDVKTNEYVEQDMIVNVSGAIIG